MIGVHSFEIPHHLVRPTRDIIIVRIPMPPSKVGSIITPDVTRDLMAHNVMAGRVEAMGPIAFHYKDGEEKWHQHDVKIGDWVTFRPFAGTMIQGGKLMASSGYRYMSVFNDVIGYIPAAEWNPVCEWEYVDPHAPEVPTAPKFDFHNLKEIRKEASY